jgi:hypothetical protein
MFVKTKMSWHKNSKISSCVLFKCISSWHNNPFYLCYLHRNYRSGSTTNKVQSTTTWATANCNIYNKTSLNVWNDQMDIGHLQIVKIESSFIGESTTALSENWSASLCKLKQLRILKVDIVYIIDTIFIETAWSQLQSANHYDNAYLGANDVCSFRSVLPSNWCKTSV